MLRFESEPEIDLADPNRSRTQLISLVGQDKSVLDVGCATGAIARELVRRGCRVSGIDRDRSAIEAPRDVLAETVVADLDQSPLTDHFKAGSFDVVVFGHVLEHLADPGAALRAAASLLLPDGRIVVSVPNVAHAAVRLGLLAGRWTGTDTPRDRTHPELCTLAGVCDLLESTDLVIEVLRSTVVDPLAVREPVFENDRLPPTVVEWVRHQPGALDHDYIVAARLLGPGERRMPRPQVEPAVPYETVRVRDQYSDELSREVEARHHVLTLRDHVHGLEATIESSQRRSQRSRARAEQAERRLEVARRELRDARAELDRASGSARRAWRKLRRLRSRGDGR